MTFFLLTSDLNNQLFIETLIDTSKIVSIRLIKDEDRYILGLEDVNNNGYSATFSTELLMRNKFKELLTVLGEDVTIADTMKIRDSRKNRDKRKDEISEKLADLLKTMKD